MKGYEGIFARTFGALSLAVLLAVQGLSWATSQDFRVNATTMGLGLLAAFIGAVVATLWAFAGSPAVGALEKAWRSAAQAVAGALSALALNSTQDLISVPRLLAASVAGIVLAFAITYLQTANPAPTT